MILHPHILARLTALPACLCAALWASPALASGPAGFEGPDAPVTASQLAPAHTAPGNASASYYNETCTATVYLPAGYVLYIQLAIGRLPFGRMDAALNMEWASPGAEHVFIKREYPLSAVKASTSPVSLAIGRNVFTFEPAGKGVATIHIDEPELALDLRLTSDFLPWRPGSGKLLFDGGKRFDATLIVPRGRAHVEAIERKTGKVSKTDGIGYLERFWANLPLYEMATRVIKVKVVNEEAVLLGSAFVLPERYGKKTVGFLYFAKGAPGEGEVQFTSGHVDARPDDIRPDPRSTDGYRVPWKSLLIARNGARRMAAKLDGQSLNARNDVLATLSPLKRAVLGTLTKPVEYSIAATYAVEAEREGGARVSQTGKATYFYIQLNP